LAYFGVAVIQIGAMRIVVGNNFFGIIGDDLHHQPIEVIDS
jgi:hypothetical protein